MSRGKIMREAAAEEIPPPRRILIESIGLPPTATAQQKGVRIVRGKPIFYQKANVAKAERDLLRRLAPFRPDRPLEGAIEIEVRFVFEASFPGMIRRKVTRPDLDNLLKLLLDCMTSLGFWHDDSQVSALRASKWEAAPGGAAILIEAKEKGKA